MCIFSQDVSAVAATSIYARVVAGAPPRQILVYQLAFRAAGDLAMVLPLPTPAASEDDAVEFVSLEDYPQFFTDMASGFPRQRSRAAPLAAAVDAQAASATLPVQEVGAFEASFVPGRADFSRLDARFRLPDTVWDALPVPADYGFAVFKLKGDDSATQQVHPMALSFPTRNRNHLYFPTLHVHDGTYPGRAVFDHDLYYQGSIDMRLPLALDAGTTRFGRVAGKVFGVQGGAKPPQSSPEPASAFMKKPAHQLVDPGLPVHRFRLHERLPNLDAMLWPRYHDKAGCYA
jgi:hypothetical protein